jgi:hypothetical protein
MNDYGLTKEALETNGSLHGMIITLIILVCINILIELIRFGISLYFSEKDKDNKRQLLIEEKRIKVLETLFKNLDSLTIYDKSDEIRMLSDLKEINLFISQNKIYIPKKIHKTATEILDYFKNVLTDFRKKSIEVETQLFQKYCNDFNK